MRFAQRVMAGFYILFLLPLLFSCILQKKKFFFSDRKPKIIFQVHRQIWCRLLRNKVISRQWKIRGLFLFLSHFINSLQNEHVFFFPLASLTFFNCASSLLHSSFFCSMAISRDFNFESLFSPAEANEDACSLRSIKLDWKKKNTSKEGKHCHSYQRCLLFEYIDSIHSNNVCVRQKE